MKPVTAGPGDEAAWGSCTSHPSDPRANSDDPIEAFVGMLDDGDAEAERIVLDAIIESASREELDAELFDSIKDAMFKPNAVDYEEAYKKIGRIIYDSIIERLDDDEVIEYLNKKKEAV